MENGIGMYIHIPFCKSKCYYCDFNSYSGMEHLAGPYFDALFEEMASVAELLGSRRVKTVFIGGGTPTLVDPKYITSLLEICSKHFHLDGNAEISIESNPGTINYDNLRTYKEAGINRLSIGLQAWQDRLLESLGRIHRRQQFVDNLEEAFRAGFTNINVDLIFGLPGQTFEDWAETLEAVTSLSSAGNSFGHSAGNSAGHSAWNSAENFAGHPERGRFGGTQDENAAGRSCALITHISCYSLQIEEGTAFGDRMKAGTLDAADDELDRAMYRYAVDTLAKKGYRHYEISNFARPGFECKHNLIYWKADEYAGFGAGAHSYLNGVRYCNTAGIEQYISAVGRIAGRSGKTGSGAADGRPGHSGLWNSSTEEIELHEDIQAISFQEAMSEFMILGLRLIDGVSEEEFEKRFGEKLGRVYGNKLDKLVNEGLVIYDRSAGSYKLSRTGLDVANKVFVEFI